MKFKKFNIKTVQDIALKKRKKDPKLQAGIIAIKLDKILDKEELVKEVKVFYIEEKVLYLLVANSNVLHYLNLNKKKLIKRIKEECSLSIKDIVFRNKEWGGINE